MRAAVVLLVLSLFALGAGSADAAIDGGGSRGGPVVSIDGDSGGRLLDYALRVAEAKQAGAQVQFRGRCDSACTLFLSLPKARTCVAAGASFRFHAPYGVGDDAARVARNYLMKEYPAWVRAWLSAQGGLSGELLTMDYEVVSKHLKTC